MVPLKPNKWGIKYTTLFYNGDVTKMVHMLPKIFPRFYSQAPHGIGTSTVGAWPALNANWVRIWAAWRPFQVDFHAQRMHPRKNADFEEGLPTNNLDLVTCHVDLMGIYHVKTWF